MSVTKDFNDIVSSVVNDSNHSIEHSYPMINNSDEIM
jgi:hypothetical protein